MKTKMRTGAIAAALALATSTAGAVMVAPPVTAQGGSCTITVTPASPVVGEPVSVVVSGFDPGEEVDWTRTINGATENGKSSADGAGVWSTSTGAFPAEQAGTWVISFTGAESGVTCSTSFQTGGGSTATSSAPGTGVTTTTAGAAAVTQPRFTG